MDIKQGFPEGYEFNRNKNYKSEHVRRQEKQQQSLDALYKSVPASMLKGTPIEYDEDGLPVVNDDPSFQPTLEQQVQSTVERPMEKNVDADAFFSTPPARQRAVTNQPRQQSNHPSQQTQPMKQGSLQHHPVLKKMLNVFGLKKNSRHDLDIYNENTGDKVIYTMTLVSEELQSWAMMEGKNKMVTEAEAGAVYFELLFGCCSVIAMDHVPLWEIFNIRLTEDEQYSIDQDPLDMSIRIRKVCSRTLADLLWSQTVPIADKLVEFYQDKVLGKKIQSSLDKEILDKVRYVCPLDDCDNYEFFKPVVENGVEKSFFCKFHGVQLVKTVDILKELDTPLA